MNRYTLKMATVNGAQIPELVVDPQGQYIDAAEVESRDKTIECLKTIFDQASRLASGYGRLLTESDDKRIGAERARDRAWDEVKKLREIVREFEIARDTRFVQLTGKVTNAMLDRLVAGSKEPSGKLAVLDEHSGIATGYASQADEIRTLRAEVDKQTIELSTAQSSRFEFAEQLRKLEGAIREATEQPVDSSVDQITYLRDKLDELRHDVAVAKQAYRTMVGNYDDKRFENESLKATIDHYTDQANMELKHTDVCPGCDHPGQCEKCWYVSYVALRGQNAEMRAKIDNLETRKMCGEANCTASGSLCIAIETCKYRVNNVPFHEQLKDTKPAGETGAHDTK